MIQQNIKDYLDGVKSRREAAVPGPWDARCKLLQIPETARHIWSVYGWIAECYNPSAPQSAEFIASMPTDSSKMEAALRVAVERVEKFKSQFDKGFPNSLDAIEARDDLFDVLFEIERILTE